MHCFEKISLINIVYAYKVQNNKCTNDTELLSPLSLFLFLFWVWLKYLFFQAIQKITRNSLNIHVQFLLAAVGIPAMSHHLVQFMNHLVPQQIGVIFSQSNTKFVIFMTRDYFTLHFIKSVYICVKSATNYKHALSNTISAPALMLLCLLCLCFNKKNSKQSCFTDS